MTAPGLKADVSDSARISGVSDSVNIATITVLAVNDSPTIASAVLPSGTEDAASPPSDTILNLFGASFSDPDAGAFFNGVAVVDNPASAATEGRWQYNYGSDWFDIGTVNDGPLALVLHTGTLVRFLPAPNYNGSPPPLSLRALDDTYAGGHSTTAFGVETRVNLDTTVNGGSTPISGTAVTLSTTVTAVNDDPYAAGAVPASITVDEDVATDVDLSGVDIDDVDAGAGLLTLTIDTTGGGTLTASSGGGVTVTGSGTTGLVLDGTLADLNAYLDDPTNIQYLGPLNAFGAGADSLDLNVSDNGNTGPGGGGFVSLGSITVDITAQNDPPVIDSDGGGPTASLSIAENNTAVTTVTATDVEPDVLTFAITGGADQTLFSINSTTGELTFVTAPDFESPADADTNNVYEVEVTVDDGNGGTDVQFISVTVTDVPNTLIVDTVFDGVPDGDVSSIEALNADKGADGRISLREAIAAANNTLNDGSPDLITFNIAGAGPHTIQLDGALPALNINEAVIIDGTSEPDFSGDPIIELDGALTTATSGLRLGVGSDGSTIRGLVINNFDSRGIVIESSGNKIAGNWIGLDTDGVTLQGNGGTGVQVLAGATLNVIGGPVPADRNVISGNLYGIRVAGDDNRILGNFIGTDRTGTSPKGNVQDGILIDDASDNLIGGATPGDLRQSLRRYHYPGSALQQQRRPGQLHRRRRDREREARQR